MRVDTDVKVQIFPVKDIQGFGRKAEERIALLGTALLFFFRDNGVFLIPRTIREEPSDLLGPILDASCSNTLELADAVRSLRNLKERDGENLFPKFADPRLYLSSITVYGPSFFGRAENPDEIRDLIHTLESFFLTPP